MGDTPADDMDDPRDDGDDEAVAAYFPDAEYDDDGEAADEAESFDRARHHDRTSPARRRAEARVTRLPRWRPLWAAYAASFLLPLAIVLALGLALRPASNEDADDAAALETAPNPVDNPLAALPPGIAFAEHTVPAYIRDDVGATRARGYLFRGEAGATWRAEVTPIRDEGLAPQVTLYDTAGDIVRQSAAPRAGASTAIELTLPQSGRYGLVVEGTAAGPTGTYLLTLFPQ